MAEIFFQKKLMKDLEAKNIFCLDTHRNPTPGCPDFFMICFNQVCPVELKVGNKKLNQYQENWKDKWFKFYNNNYIIIYKNKNNYSFRYFKKIIFPSPHLIKKNLCYNDIIIFCKNIFIKGVFYEA